MLKKILWLLSMLKTYFCETLINFFQDSLMNRKYMNANIIVSLLNKLKRILYYAHAAFGPGREEALTDEKRNQRCLLEMCRQEIDRKCDPKVRFHQWLSWACKPFKWCVTERRLMNQCVSRDWIACRTHLPQHCCQQREAKFLFFWKLSDPF